MAASYEDQVAALIRELDGHIRKYDDNFRRLGWREKVQLLVNAGFTLKELGKHTDAEARKVSAQERIRLYLVRYVGVIIEASELEVVSGISDYARRIRQLRVENGYKILTGYSNDPELGLDLKPTQYLLIDPEPDHKAARRWHLANKIRRQEGMGSQAKLLQYFKESVGEVITTEELAYVANNKKQYARRVRELRTEQGYPIATRFTGRPDLRSAEYVMESVERVAEPHDRNIPFNVQKDVYARDENKCVLCGWTHDMWTRDDPRILELHHLQEHAHGGRNSLANLIVICSRCHDNVHAGRQQIPPDLFR